MNKILVIVGPNASGKSALAVKLAKKLNGEVVSADSRQVYRGLNIGTGKITKKEMRGVPHHLLDVAEPTRPARQGPEPQAMAGGQFSVEKYKKLAEEAIDKIIDKKKLPILCGGTGYYIQAVVDGHLPAPVPPNPNLRRRLAKKSAAELFKMLKKLDRKRAAAIDPKNSRRLIRAIEIAKKLGRVPPVKMNSKYQALRIGIKVSDTELKKSIRARLRQRLRRGMIGEAKKLHQNGLSWKRMDELGLEYRYLARYLQNKISKNEMIEKIYTENWRYAKRQMTWFKKEKRIKWASLSKGDLLEIIL